MNLTYVGDSFAVILAVGIPDCTFGAVLILDLQHGVVPYNLGLALALKPQPCSALPSPTLIDDL